MQRFIMSSAPRRGTVVVFTAVSMSLLIGFAALAVDIGYAYSIQAELQRTADASALAGAGVLTSEQMLLDGYDPTSDILLGVELYAASNAVGNEAPAIDINDVFMGFLADPTDPDEVLNEGVPPSSFNAVKVIVRRQDGLNGEITTFLASIFGVDSIALGATATAAVDDRFTGFHPPSDGLSPLVPFSVDIDKYTQDLLSGDDLWSWTPGASAPSNTSDGFREIWLYPDFGGESGGNFGTLNIGIGSQGTAQLESQIENGLTEQSLIDEIGTPNIIFYDDAGNPVTYTITGNPGLSGGLADSIEARLGDVIGFFIHDSVSNNGSLSQFNVIGMRFGRVMEIVLTGNPDQKRLVIQPLPYTGPGVEVGPVAGSSGGMVVSLRLTK